MKALRLFSGSATALVAVAALALGVFALLPGTLDAGERCVCPPINEEVRGWGMAAASCAAAKASCEANANMKAFDLCSTNYDTGVCAWGSITFQPANCYFEGGMWKVDCPKTFACERCIPGPEIPPM